MKQTSRAYVHYKRIRDYYITVPLPKKFHKFSENEKSKYLTQKIPTIRHQEFDVSIIDWKYI